MLDAHLCVAQNTMALLPSVAKPLMLDAYGSFVPISLEDCGNSTLIISQRSAGLKPDTNERERASTDELGSPRLSGYSALHSRQLARSLLVSTCSGAQRRRDVRLKKNRGLTAIQGFHVVHAAGLPDEMFHPP